MGNMEASFKVVVIYIQGYCGVDAGTSNMKA
jgi:hypothetical protein